MSAAGRQSRSTASAEGDGRNPSGGPRLRGKGAKKLSKAAINVWLTEEITLEKLRRIFDEQVIRTPTGQQTLNMPSDGAIARLAKILTGHRSIFLAAAEARAFNQKLADAEKAIETLRRLMPEIYESRKRAAAAGDPFSKPMARAAEKLLLAINYSAGPLLVVNETEIVPDIFASLHRETWVDSINGWQWLDGKSEVLRQDFETTILSTNPSLSVGYGDEGPLSRFLAAIIPLVTGEPAPADLPGGLKKIRRKNKERDAAS